ncbi:MaoC family dehydratase [Nostocoides sp. F2B08]|uniref:FAS1-like dehydratase domain-containing protein n=1 Tax=Nostocoides sp. F2B08 TaxID=2653936 RepID=UPI001263B09C|nr:MaoC family dehydratase N-terminal domain-containing protein [Tetrasphaera sp. F2B08]KAB7746367.1 MaoC family dehydratase [Tetrasphaera sp. F2B08]
MSVNTDFAGRTMAPAGPFPVDADLIAQFAAAVGASDPIHTDAVAARARGYRDVVAPPTMAVRFEQQAQAAYVGDPDAGIDFSRVVHGEQAFTHHRPIVAGDEITGTTTVTSIREAGGHAMITVTTELTDADTEPVCTAVSTIVVRGGD